MTTGQLSTTPIINEWIEGSDYFGRSVNIKVDDVVRDLHVFHARFKRDSQSINKLPKTIYLRNKDSRYIQFGRFAVESESGLTITYKPDMMEQKRIRGCGAYSLIVEYF